MAIPGSAGPFLLAQLEEEGGYEIERSLRLNSSDSAYLSRTPASAGNRKTWTWAGWVKRSGLSNSFPVFSAGVTGTSYLLCRFRPGDTFGFDQFGTANNFFVETIPVYRDASAWYHVVFAFDTTQSTQSNRIKVYINGVQQALTAGTNWPAQNADLLINNNIPHSVGSDVSGFGGGYLSGYLADIHFIDGQALTPTSFGEFDTNGVWQPKAYAGSYGTNGFHLPFSDNSTAAALGTDTSGNSNTWTVNNLSVTTGAGNDSLVDSPTNYGEDTGAGGEVRGNYATLNPIERYGATTTFTNGNLEVAITSGGGAGPYPAVRPTINPFNQGAEKYYSEITIGSKTSLFQSVGANTKPDSMTGSGDIFVLWRSDGLLVEGGVSATRTGTGVSYTNGDIIGVAYNNATLELKFYKNNSLVVTWAFTTIPASFNIYCGTDATTGTGNFAWNFGQRPFAYTAPSGFKALCTTNLPEPTIADGSTVMDVALYTGNGSTQTISGLNFDPDLVWIKRRSGAIDHALYDTVRTATKQLESNTTTAETTEATGLTAFATGGFSLGALAQVNTSSATYAAWTWDAGTSTVTNTQGSITSQVRANASAGFSVVTYTGTSAPASIGHGLGVAPTFAIIKRRDFAQDWYVSTTVISGLLDYLALNKTSASAWTGVSVPSSTVFNLGTGESNNALGSTYVGYCFAPVAGYSSFGRYTGNGLADGPFVYTGFRPKYLLWKSTGSGQWFIHDTSRSPYNFSDLELVAETSGAEYSANGAGAGQRLDFLSNGFKVRTSNIASNSNGVTYIYAAFAEHPFSISRAR